MAEKICQPPEVRVCSETVGHAQLCLCVAQTNAQCKVEISYPANTPPQATVKLSPGCDAAGLEFALAVLLSKLAKGMPVSK